jgi:hypothetical protein
MDSPETRGTAKDSRGARAPAFTQDLHAVRSFRRAGWILGVTNLTVFAILAVVALPSAVATEGFTGGAGSVRATRLPWPRFSQTNDLFCMAASVDGQYLFMFGGESQWMAKDTVQTLSRFHFESGQWSDMAPGQPWRAFDALSGCSTMRAFSSDSSEEVLVVRDGKQLVRYAGDGDYYDQTKGTDFYSLKADRWTFASLKFKSFSHFRPFRQWPDVVTPDGRFALTNSHVDEYDPYNWVVRELVMVNGSIPTLEVVSRLPSGRLSTWMAQYVAVSNTSFLVMVLDRYFEIFNLTLERNTTTGLRQLVAHEPVFKPQFPWMDNAEYHASWIFAFSPITTSLWMISEVIDWSREWRAFSFDADQSRYSQWMIIGNGASSKSDCFDRHLFASSPGTGQAFVIAVMRDDNATTGLSRDHLYKVDISNAPLLALNITTGVTTGRASSVPSLPVKSPARSSSNFDWPIALIIGIVTVAGMVLILIMIWTFIRRRRKRHSSVAASHTSTELSLLEHAEEL